MIDKVRPDGQHFDLLSLTHIDDDHIGGILKWFDKDKSAHELIGEVWFNSGRLIARKLDKPENADIEHLINPQQSTTLSIVEGMTFSKYIVEKGIWFEKLIMQGDVLQCFNPTFRILSPDQAKLERLLKKWNKKDPDLSAGTPLNDYKLSLAGHIAANKYWQDNAYPNSSSIAFIPTYNNHELLFFGDSHPAVIRSGLDALNKLAFTAGRFGWPVRRFLWRFRGSKFRTEFTG